MDDVLPENGDEGNPGCRLFVGARLALRHCRLGPSGGDSLIDKNWDGEDGDNGQAGLGEGKTFRWLKG